MPEVLAVVAAWVSVSAAPTLIATLDLEKERKVLGVVLPARCSLARLLKGCIED